MEGNFKAIINFESSQLSYYYAYTAASVGAWSYIIQKHYILYSTSIMHTKQDSNANTEDLHNGIYLQ